jgi:hypothetical protein
MATPVISTYYFSTSSFPGTKMGALTTVQPPNSKSVWGWNTGRNNPPLFCQLNFGTEVIRTSTQWLGVPRPDSPSTNTSASGFGNSWMMGPFNGEFVQGQWNLSMSVASVTLASPHQGRFVYRVWTARSGSGGAASLVTASYISSSAISMSAVIGAVFVGSASFVLPSINLHKEYVFFQTQWSIMTAAGLPTTNTSVDTDLVFGTASILYPTAFVTHSSTSHLSWEQEDYG